MRKPVQLEEQVKDHLQSLHDLYGFKTLSETMEFILIQHDLKIRDTMPVTEFMYYQQCKKEGKSFKMEGETSMNESILDMIKEDYGLELTGVSPLCGSRNYQGKTTKFVVKDFGNGMGRVVYVDKQNRFVATMMERI